MAITISKLKRKFEIERNGKTIYLTDPNPALTVEEVADFYSSSYPELLNASHTTAELEGSIIYKFKTVAGTKG